ncbi:MAG: FAD-dependent oxidoreductase [archaeon]
MKQYDVAIIGAGPAGLTAGIYTARYGLKTVIIDKGLPGGTAMWAGHIKNYPGFEEISGMELMTKFTEHAKKCGAEIMEGTITSIKDLGKEKEVVLQGESLKVKAVIVAVGAKSKWLKVPGEKEYLNKGVHFCATCDGPMYQGKNVAIIGYDSRAADEALYLAEVASKVTMVCSKSALTADAAKQKLIKEKKIDVLTDTKVVSFKGTQFLEEINLKDAKGKVSTLKATGAFVYIGSEPNTEFVNVKKDEQGRIVINQSMETSVKGIFAAGDCIKKELNQIATCVGEGAIAAHSAARLLQSTSE